MRIQNLNGNKVAVLTPVDIMRLRVINIESIKIQKLEEAFAPIEAIQEAKDELEDIKVYFNDKVRKQNRRPKKR